MKESRQPDPSPVSLAGYQRRLHKADVAILTPSRTHWHYMLVDGTLHHMVRSLTPVVVESSPASLEAAHRELSDALQTHPVWILLRDVEYPAWAVATMVQVQGATGTHRVFVVRGRPRFTLVEFTF